MKKVLLLLLIVSLAVTAGCGSTNTQAPAPKDSSIKIGGSSTLAPTIANCANDFTEKYQTWKKVNAQLPDEQIVIFVASGGSGLGVNSAINGTVDIGLVSREIKDSEKAKLPNHKFYTLGYDALTIAVNPKNPVLQVKPNLTAEEVKKIFSGELKTWQQLDASLPNRPIVVAVRDLGGGATQAFDEAIMKGTPITKEAIQLPSMGALAGKVQENVDAIGYVSVGFVQADKAKFGVLSVNGIAPTSENIAAGKYQIARPLIIITKDKPDDKQQNFIEYLLSENGYKAIEAMGFVPVRVK
ncbi:MAG TPA: phosphate ABC transporter substrate-binding protein [Selenomonadales bacterium]|nr:phosphate ABC transporter substrate-binding protein [Selenomonadales bacterium]